MIALLAALAMEPMSVPEPPLGTADFAASCLVAAERSEAMHPRERDDGDAARADRMAADYWSGRLDARSPDAAARAAVLKRTRAALDDSLAQIDAYYGGVRFVNLRLADCQYVRRIGADG